MHFLLFYDLVPDYAERRGAFRDAHLAKAWAANERGELLVAGALTDPLDRAVLMFSADSPAVVEEFARTDPYVTNGLVTSWSVRAWTTVAGTLAATPVRPARP
ncbi:MAG: YCII-related protein [Gemmatimonadetes bacterium]|nr:YCII-related protein [Gemmatimonadota bacterium]